ncbi:MAG TPA: hypothetical protein VLB27_03665 [candidate division Zixibacteria bacterium]|nr:hypothetical protein [candidate division Zixibacteria bacterium]
MFSRVRLVTVALELLCLSGTTWAGRAGTIELAPLGGLTLSHDDRLSSASNCGWLTGMRLTVPAGERIALGFSGVYHSLCAQDLSPVNGQAGGRRELHNVEGMFELHVRFNQEAVTPYCLLRLGYVRHHDQLHTPYVVDEFSETTPAVGAGLGALVRAGERLSAIVEAVYTSADAEAERFAIERWWALRAGFVVAVGHD